MEFRILLFTITILFVSSTTRGQFISKKESVAIDKLLTELSATHKPKTYLFQHVNIITMKDAQVMKDQSVLVENGIIEKIGTDIQHPDAIIIDGTNKFLMPGLTDMHVHLFDKHPMRNTWMLLLLIHGVTTIRDMCGEEGKLVLRERIKRSEILAPNLYQAGPIINGVRDNTGLFSYASTPEEGRALVVSQKKMGYDFIKVYDGLSKEVYAAIADESHQQGMMVTGHLPDDITLDDAIKNNPHTVEHLTGYFEWKDNQVFLTASKDYASLTANSTLWNCPTLYNHYMNGSRKGASDMFEYAASSGLLPAELIKLWKKRISSNAKEVVEIVDRYGASNFETLQEIVRNLYEANAKLIAGTDAGNLPLLIPGYSLHQELKLMTDLGIPTYDVLKMATVNAASALNKEDGFGTIEAGKRADLLLLNASPLIDINNLNDKGGVMVRGIWLSDDDIKKLTDQIKATFGN